MSTASTTTYDVVDPGRWPDVVNVPQHRLRAVTARRLVMHAVRSLPLVVVLPGGARLGGGRPGDPTMRLVRPHDFFARLGAGGLIGFGEAYMAGDWESDDLSGVLTVLANRLSTLVPPSLQRLRGLAVPHRPGGDQNTLHGSRQNVHHHYDLSNELFETFLDSSMSYSAALFDADGPATDESLYDAQQRKTDRLLTVAGVTAGSRMLEIGTGWGELAIRAAARGAHVTSVTLSAEQADLARRRIAAAGFGDCIDVQLADYREVTGAFDAIVSAEMIEAVGADHWDEYFACLHRLLVPGGRAALQAITMPHDRMLATMGTYTWILKYIFPGGQLPSVQAVRDHATRAGLAATSELAFGASYAETLRRWRATFEGRADDVDRLGFDATFRRMWSLYLAYSEAGFRSGYLDVCQFGLTRASDPSAGHA
ncbi:MAG: class I SAM-dependent methyltransferase [Nocardioidaceae bacterium]